MTNQFDAGYFAVKKAVQAIEKEQERSQLSLESYYIEKDELRSKKYEKMLYRLIKNPGGSNRKMKKMEKAFRWRWHFWQWAHFF